MLSEVYTVFLTRWVLLNPSIKTKEEEPDSRATQLSSPQRKIRNLATGDHPTSPPNTGQYGLSLHKWTPKISQVCTYQTYEIACFNMYIHCVTFTSRDVWFHDKRFVYGLHIQNIRFVVFYKVSEGAKLSQPNILSHTGTPRAVRATWGPKRPQGLPRMASAGARSPRAHL